MLGVKKDEVKLVFHNPEWGKLFQQDKELLESIIGEHVVAIEHFGSTSIHGIKAKPVIDILIGVQSLEDVKKFDMKKLSEASYYHLPRVQIEGKIVFAKFTDLESLTRTHYLHIVECKGEWWNEHLLFRDRLNERTDLAKEYEALKVKYADQFYSDVTTYTNAKEAFVEKVLKL